MSLSSRRRVADRLPSPRRRSVLENLESRTLLHGGVGFEAHVNFQPAGAVVPAGYVADTGSVYSDRGGGLAFGWNVTNTLARERNSSLAPDQRYDTLTQMRGTANVWEMAVPNGTYSVRIVAGDPGAYDSTYAIAAEGVTVVGGKPTSAVRFFDGSKVVTVTDGRLTVTNAAGSANNKIAFIDIHQEDVSPELPEVSVAAADARGSEEQDPEDWASFVVQRFGPVDADLTVRYTVGGTATFGTDYAVLGGSVVIPAGEASALVLVEPLFDGLEEPDETVVLTLSPSPEYALRSPASAGVTIVDDNTPAGFSAKVNFQPGGAPVPAGYVADTGQSFDDRDNGFVYGWNVANSSYARDRNSGLSPDQRYDTLTQMRGAGNVWEISVPNGTFSVRIVAGDPSAYDSTYAIAAEGVTVVSGKPTSSVRWFDGTKTVSVNDGRLTVTNAAGSSNNKIAFIEISQPGGSGAPVVSISTSDTSASETPGNPGAVTVTRSGPTDAPLEVELRVEGTAARGWDYDELGINNRVTIPAGASSVTVPVRPVDDDLVEGTESVVVTLVGSSHYFVGQAGPVTVNIADNDATPGTTLSWREVAPATVGRSEAMGAAVNGKLYHFGGYVDTTYKPTTRADVYDPAANRWSPIASLPFGVSHAGTAVVGDSIYFAGGYPATSTGQSFATVRVTRYDTTTNTYQTNLPSLPLSRGGGALVALGRKLHFFGGSDSSRRDAAQHWALDLDNLAAGWVAKAPLPVATNHVAGAVVGGSIYAVGGQQGQDAAAVHRADVQMYDPATDRWTARAPMPAAKSHITNATIVRDGRIIVLGGMGTGERVLGTVNSYDPGTNTWSSLTSLPTGRMSGVADLLPDGRIVFATGGSGFRTNTWIGSFA